MQRKEKQLIEKMFKVIQEREANQLRHRIKELERLIKEVRR